MPDDLYALGAVGYEALTGRRPFPQEDLGALTHAILHETPPPLCALRPDVPPGLAAVIERAMARDRRQRFDQASTMRAALAGTHPAPIPVPPAAAFPPLPRVRRPTRVMGPPPYTSVSARLELDNRRRKLWAGAIIALLVLAFTLFASGLPFSASPPKPATTPAPSPPPTTSFFTTPSSTEQPPPAPQPPLGHPGKKHKGDQGD